MALSGGCKFGFLTNVLWCFTVSLFIHLVLSIRMELGEASETTVLYSHEIKSIN